MVFVTDSVQLLQQIPYKEACEGSGYFEIRAPVIRTVKYAGDLVLLAGGECYRPPAGNIVGALYHML